MQGDSLSPKTHHAILMFSNRVLYYPTIEFSDENFLRRSLLLWDRVYRIVPQGYNPNDSDFVKGLIDEGLVVNLTPSQKYAQETADKLKDLIYSPTHAAGLSTSTILPQNNDAIATRLHYSKVNNTIKKLFYDFGLRLDNQGFYHVSPEFASYYMLLLAQGMATHRRINLATDSKEIWSVTPYFTEKGNFGEHSSDNDGQKALGSLVLPNLFPEGIATATAKDIIQLSNTMRDQRAFLREKVSGLMNILSTTETPEELTTECAIFMTEVDKAKEEFRNSNKFWQSGAPTSALTVGLPYAATLYGAFQNMIGAFGGFALSTIAYFKDYRAVKQRRNASYAAYLVGLEDKSQPSGIADYASMALDEFIND